MCPHCTRILTTNIFASQKLHHRGHGGKEDQNLIVQDSHSVFSVSFVVESFDSPVAERLDRTSQSSSPRPSLTWMRSPAATESASRSTRLRSAFQATA